MLALVAVSYFCYTALGSDLLPAMDEGGFMLDYLMPAGSSLADTNEVLLGRGEDSREDAGGGKHFAPHRIAAGSGRRDGGQYRRLLGQAEARIATAASMK